MVVGIEVAVEVKIRTSNVAGVDEGRKEEKKIGREDSGGCSELDRWGECWPDRRKPKYL